MEPNKSKKTDLEVASDFDSLFNEIPEPQTDEEIQAFLADAGYDIQTLRAKGRDFVNELMASNWRFVSPEELNQVSAQIDEIPLRLHWSRERLVAAFQKVTSQLTSAGMQPSLGFRNQEKLTELDLATILQELEYQARKNGIELDLE
jgi:hypothetical protein